MEHQAFQEFCLNGGSIAFDCDGRFIVSDIGFDSPISHSDNAFGPGSDIVFVGYHDDSFACFIEFGKQMHDFVAGFGIEISCGFISKDNSGVVDEASGNGDALLLAA